MKLNNFFLFCSIVTMTLFASCNKEELGNELGREDANTSMQVSFAISLPNTPSTLSAQAGTTRDVPTGDGGLYKGTTDEQKVNAVRIVLYDGDVVAYALDYDIKMDGNAAFNGTDVSTAQTATSAQFVTKAKPVANNDYKAVILLNPTATVKAVTQKGDGLTAFNQAVTASISEVTPGGAILMSNEQGLINVSASNLKTSALEAEKNPVAGRVDRILAKVFVNGSEASVVGGTLTGTEFRLDVTNRKTFWMRKLAMKVANGSGTTESINDGSLRINRYAEDPNFTTINTIDVDNFDYVPEGATADGFNPTGYKDENGIYALENTMEAAAQLQGATTRVILKGVFTPEGFTSGDTWFSYKGFKISNDAMADFETNKDNADYFKDTPEGFQEAVKEFAGLSIRESLVTPLGINCYVEGVCYYFIPIRHFNNTIQPTPMGYGRFGIVRNNIYKVNISKVNGPGAAIITPPKPETPDEDNTYISFSVEVNPWLVREIDYEI